MAGTITAIEVQQRNPRRVNIFVDGAYTLALGLDIATRNNLKRGQTLSDDDIARLVTEDTWQKTYDAALNFLSYRPRSEEEMRRYLDRRKVTAEMVEQVIARLKASGLVDDTVFARFWVESRENFSPRSQRALRAELRRKGVDDSTINSSLPGNDSEAAYRAAEKKLRSLANADYETFRRRLIPFLQRRGFGYETAREAVARLWNEVQGHKADE